MLAVINRSILPCGLLSTARLYIMKFLFLLLLFLKFCEIFAINDVYFHFHIVCTPHLFWGGGKVESLTKFSKSLTGPQLLEGGWWERGG